MTEFAKYQHIETFGSDEVEAIERGTVHLFPKIDGTNASVWYDERGLHFGSRSREITPDDDNQGFAAWASQSDALKEYFNRFGHHRLYGEWLVPHTLKGYREDAWRRFYVFDVTVGEGDDHEYLPYDRYQPLVEQCGIDYVTLMAVCENATLDQFIRALDANTFLMQDGKGAGEGVVLKNYSYRNKYGRVTWAKLVRAEFKDKHRRTMGVPIIKGTKLVEEELTVVYCTDAFVKKEHGKIVAEKEGWSSRYIPELLGRVWHAFVTEHTWAMVKTKKNPTIDYKVLQQMVVARAKQALPEVF